MRPNGFFARNMADRDIVLLAIVSASLIYIALLYISTTPRVPLLTAVFVGCNMLSRTLAFQGVMPKVVAAVNRTLNLNAPNVPSRNNNGNRRIDLLTDSSRDELLSAIRSLQAYSTEFRKSNERRRRLFKLMSWRQQKLCEDVGYLTKLKKMDTSVQTNQKLLSKVAEHAVDEYGVTYHDFQVNQTSNNTSNSMYRVIEALSHFVRDWTDYGAKETSPMLKYIKTQLDAVIPAKERANTCVIVPGSGVGGVAHEIAKMGFEAVHAVEFSGLMHSANQYMYSKNDRAKIFPVVHSCSNFSNSKAQFRLVDIEPTTKPNNLHLHLADFRYFKPEVTYDNMVIVTAFFVDTAENLMDYLDTMVNLTSKSSGVKQGYWINVGPLKYGSAAQVELNSEEIAEIRRRMGWEDLDRTNSLEKPLEYGDNGLVGYATDRDSMWQGFYGLAMWLSKRKRDEK